MARVFAHLQIASLTAALTLLSLNSASAQSTASISGSTVDSGTGKPIVGAIVMAFKPSAPTLSRSATTAFDGSFQIPALPSGVYQLCVQVPQDGYLASCQWGSVATSVTLAAAQQSTGNKISLKPASILKVHLDDPQRLLAQKTKGGYSQHLATGVWSGSAFYPAHIAAQGAISADYQVTIPFDTSLRFTIQSATMALGNPSGAALALSDGDAQPIEHPSGVANLPNFSYSIAGAK